MMLINSAETLNISDIYGKVLEVFKEIAVKIKIKPQFQVNHEDLPQVELPPALSNRLQQLPLDMQEKYLSNQLQWLLYGIYYNNYLKAAFDEENNSENLRQQDLENNTFLGVNLDFYNSLHRSNAGGGYFDPGWRVLRRESDGTLAVNKNGLTLHLQPSRHLSPSEENATPGESVAVKMPPNLVQNGFYMAVGNAGPQGRGSQRHFGDPDNVRIYFHFSSAGAIAVMELLTQELNQLFVPFSFKVLYNPSDYKRYDSGVLYFDKRNYAKIRPVVDKVIAATQEHFRAEIPLFTKPIASGVGLAEEPNRKFSIKDSFGLNRCQIIANGLLTCWRNQDESPEARLHCILAEFSQAGIDLRRPYLNFNSEDIYT